MAEVEDDGSSVRNETGKLGRNQILQDFLVFCRIYMQSYGKPLGECNQKDHIIRLIFYTDHFICYIEKR